MSFDAYDVSLELIRTVRPIVAALREHDSSLANQLRDAASSVTLNLSEGRRRAGRDRKHLWRIAAGSANEMRACLDVARAWGYLGDERTAAAHAPLDRVLAMLWKLTR